MLQCFQCYHQHKCYPGKRLWAFYLVPGALVAIVGLIIYAFLETNANYQFTHSSWHACMAVAILFILPPRDKKEGQYLMKEVFLMITYCEIVVYMMCQLKKYNIAKIHICVFIL